MSYDVFLTVDTGDPEPAYLDLDWNYTSNCSGMWCAAGADLRTFKGKPAGECVQVLMKAIDAMVDNPEKYRAMNPPNGWGDYDSLLPALWELVAAFSTHPKATVDVSW